MVDAVVALLGVPDAVFAATGFGSHPEQVRAHDTEDAAAMTFGYADDRVATITCRRAPAGSSWELVLHGGRATVAVTHPTYARGHRESDQVSCGAGGGVSRFGSPVRIFAQTLAAGAARFASQVEDHLGTMATISAAYLSVRTGQVESPHKFLELADAGRR
jgi:predicted dehydrogenase